MAIDAASRDSLELTRSVSGSIAGSLLGEIDCCQTAAGRRLLCEDIAAPLTDSRTIEKRLALKAQYPDAEHPVVRTHPETEEKVLFVNAFTTHFTNFHTKENVRFGQDANPGAALLLNYLISQACIPEYQVRWRWQKNSVAIWDNRATQHYAVMDYPPCHRKMERAGIIGGKTF